jgi:two-component system, OmpR family, phosphate regulon sensor histidine kinase PhoR
VQLPAEHFWLRLNERLEPVVTRLSARRIELGLLALLALFFVAAGGLSARVALIGVAAAAVAAATLPDRASQGPRTIAERDRIEFDRLWRAVIDALPEPAIALNEAGQVLHANRLADDQFATRKRRGAHLATIVRDPGLLSAVEETLSSREGRAVELHGRVPVERRLLATMAPLQDEGAPTGPTLLITFRDLTEQDRLARMRADFIANASHELRTPLASLKGYVETLQGSAKDDAKARERFLKTMAEQAERMSRLVDDLLSLSRVEMREYLPLIDEVALGPLLAEVTQMIEPLAEQADIRLTIAQGDDDALVRGDRDELTQVFQNLLQNAIKYGRPGGKVELHLARERIGPPRYRIDVIDDGPGIAPEHLPRLTERFYRVSAAASREKGGTGLGLAIVKHILNRHRGELVIASELGRGSTFSVTLPAIES